MTRVDRFLACGAAVKAIQRREWGVARAAAAKASPEVAWVAVPDKELRREVEKVAQAIWRELPDP